MMSPTAAMVSSSSRSSSAATGTAGTSSKQRMAHSLIIIIACVNNNKVRVKTQEKTGEPVHEKMPRHKSVAVYHASLPRDPGCGERVRCCGPGGGRGERRDHHHERPPAGRG